MIPHYLSLAASFVSQTLANAGLEYWIRWLFIVNGIVAMAAAVGFVLTANPLHIVGLMSVGLWSITFPIATTLLAIVFRRARPAE